MKELVGVSRVYRLTLPFLFQLSMVSSKLFEEGCMTLLMGLSHEFQPFVDVYFLVPPRPSTYF